MERENSMLSFIPTEEAYKPNIVKVLSVIKKDKVGGW